MTDQHDATPPETREVRSKETCHTADDADWRRRLVERADSEGARMMRECGYANLQILTRTLTAPTGEMGYGSTLESTWLLSGPVSSDD